jgi:hypothetical protein
VLTQPLVQAELVEGGEVCLAVNGELGDLVKKHVDGMAALMARAAVWIHSLASGATAHAPTRMRRSRSASSPRVPRGSRS